ncbi:hypothetical protein N7449_008427, partial [Penicillium cf. viridicatum]
DLLWHLEGCRFGIISSQAKRASRERQFPGVSFDRSQFVSCHRAPLAALIARLRHLGQIEFLVKNDFPISLQEAISQHHPKCQLNLWWPQDVGTSVPSLKKQTSPRVRDRMAKLKGPKSGNIHDIR